MAPAQIEWSVLNSNPPFQTRDLPPLQALLGAIAGYVLGERSGQRQSRGQNTQES